jgi:hypothetical protein
MLFGCCCCCWSARVTGAWPGASAPSWSATWGVPSRRCRCDYHQPRRHHPRQPRSPLRRCRLRRRIRRARGWGCDPRRRISSALGRRARTAPPGPGGAARGTGTWRRAPPLPHPRLPLRMPRSRRSRHRHRRHYPPRLRFGAPGVCLTGSRRASPAPALAPAPAPWTFAPSSYGAPACRGPLERPISAGWRQHLLRRDIPVREREAERERERGRERGREREDGVETLARAERERGWGGDGQRRTRQESYFGFLDFVFVWTHRWHGGGGGCLGVRIISSAAASGRRRVALLLHATAQQVVGGHVRHGDREQERPPPLQRSDSPFTFCASFEDARKKPGPPAPQQFRNPGFWKTDLITRAIAGRHPATRNPRRGGNDIASTPSHKGCVCQRAPPHERRGDKKPPKNGVETHISPRR